MIGLLVMLEYCFDKIEREFSRCWSILAKNHILCLKKCSFMIGLLFMWNYCFDKLEREFSRCWSILAKNHVISLKNVLLWLDYFLCSNTYCICSTVKSSLDGQNILKFARPPTPPILLWILMLALWGARVFNFFKKKIIPGFTC